MFALKQHQPLEASCHRPNKSLVFLEVPIEQEPFTKSNSKFINPDKAGLFESSFCGRGVNLRPPSFHITRRSNLISM